MKTQNFLVGLLTVGISLSAGRAIAVPLDPHAYARQIAPSNALDVTGSQVTYSTGTDGLAFNSAKAFINKEIWVGLNANPAYECWVEAGMTKGGVRRTLQSGSSDIVFQNGHFIGYQSINQSTGLPEYHDAPYGSTTGVTGPQIYTLEKVAGNGNWRILINGVTALTLNSVVCTANGTTASNYPANAGGYVPVGIEASDSAAVFTTKSVASAWIIRKGSGSYQTVSSASNIDKNTLGWVSSFLYDSNKNFNTIGFGR